MGIKPTLIPKARNYVSCLLSVQCTVIEPGTLSVVPVLYAMYVIFPVITSHLLYCSVDFLESWAVSSSLLNHP